MLSKKARAILDAHGLFGDVDMIFSRDLTSKKRTMVEDLVLKWYNEGRKQMASSSVEWSQVEATREDFDFEGGWTSDDRFETVGCAIAEVLSAGGDMRPFFRFLDDIESIAPLEELWVCVEATLEWVRDWYELQDGDFGHYLEPVYIKFKREPKRKERSQIEDLFADMIEDEIDEDEDSPSTLIIGIIIDIDAEFLVDQLELTNDIVPIELVGIGVNVRS